MNLNNGLERRSDTFSIFYGCGIVPHVLTDLFLRKCVILTPKVNLIVSYIVAMNVSVGNCKPFIGWLTDLILLVFLWFMVRLNLFTFVCVN